MCVCEYVCEGEGVCVCREREREGGKTRDLLRPSLGGGSGWGVKATEGEEITSEKKPVRLSYPPPILLLLLPPPPDVVRVRANCPRRGPATVESRPRPAEDTRTQESEKEVQ